MDLDPKDLEAREKFKEELEEMLQDDELMAFGNEDEVIYKIDDLTVYGGFELGVRGVDHHVLMTDEMSWEDLMEWGTVVVPETRTYISDEPLNEFEEIGFSNLPKNNNYIVGIKEEKEHEPTAEIDTVVIEDMYEDLKDLEFEVSDIKEYEGFTDEDFLAEAEDIVDRYIEEEAEILADDATYYDVYVEGTEINDSYLNHTLNQKREKYMENEKKNIEYKKERLEELPKLEKQIEDKFSELKEELNLSKDMRDQEVIDEVNKFLFPEKEYQQLSKDRETDENEKLKRQAYMQQMNMER